MDIKARMNEALEEAHVSAEKEVRAITEDDMARRGARLGVMAAAVAFTAAMIDIVADIQAPIDARMKRVINDLS